MVSGLFDVGGFNEAGRVSFPEYFPTWEVVANISLAEVMLDQSVPGFDGHHELGAEQATRLA
jgi:hypothetical protein